MPLDLTYSPQSNTIIGFPWQSVFIKEKQSLSFKYILNLLSI